ncbi:MAG: FAD-binding oxidoreductase [Acidimicrobiales bacterium]|nr:FAD-binding oxidoreductase [Acidimicrobiales bacterium]
MNHRPPGRDGYDVVIIGGAVMGSSAAWFLSANPDFDGSVLVVERDPSYEFTSTAHTNSCMRQQFSNEVNIRISQFAADFVRNFRSHLGDDPEVPNIPVDHFGYLYLADTESFAATLRHNQELQASWGAGTKILSPAEIAAAYPFYDLDGIVCGSHNLVDEGYFDSGTMFDWWRRKARQNGVEYVANEVVGISHDARRVQSVELASGESVACGTVVNAAGPRAIEVARMIDAELPVEPRKRFSFVFDAAEPLDRRLPLTIDPSGVHVRSDGDAYMAGCPPDVDPPVDYDDFAMDHDIWEDKVWPAIANRIPAFERVKVTSRWAGHYAYNTLDQNVIIGPHHEIENFVFMNGFSGHGMQQSPAVGRGVSEWITYGEFRSLDLSPLGYHRIAANEPFVETAVI